MAVFLKRKMTSIQKVKLEILEVSFVRMGALFWEDWVVLAPDKERRRLVRSEVLLPQPALQRRNNDRATGRSDGSASDR